MKKLTLTCIALLTATPLLLNSSRINAEPPPAIPGNEVETLQPASTSASELQSNNPLDPAAATNRTILTRENFLVIHNCFNTRSTNLEIGIPLTCQPRLIPTPKGVGAGDFVSNDISDRDSFKIDIVRTEHPFESGRSQGLGFRVRL